MQAIEQRLLNKHYFTNFISVLLFICLSAMPLTSLSVPSIPSGLFYGTVLLAIVAQLIVWRKALFLPPGLQLKNYKMIFFLCLLVTLSIVLSQLVMGERIGTELERALRFSLGLPILIMGFRLIPANWLKFFMISVFATVIFATVYMTVLVWPELSERPMTADVGQYNTVSYSLILLLLVVCTYYSLGIALTKWTKTEFTLKLLIALFGTYGFIMSQTRTGLMAVPVFIVLGLMLLGLKKLKVKTVLSLVLGLLVAGVLMLQIPVVKDRVELAKNEVIECQADSTKFTSICIRLQLWGAAYDLWERHPWFGTGSDSNFQEALEDYYLPRGLVHEDVAKGWGEPHQDYLKVASSFGIFALLAHLFVYFAPLWVFARRLLKSEDKQIQCFAAMGCAFCLGFFVFGFFELMFREMRTMGLYVEMLAVFWVLSGYPPNTFQKRKPN